MIGVRGVALVLAAYALPAWISDVIYSMRRSPDPTSAATFFAYLPASLLRQYFPLLAVALALFWFAPWVAHRAVERGSR